MGGECNLKFVLDAWAGIWSSWISVMVGRKSPGEWGRLGVRGGARGMRGEIGGENWVDSGCERDAIIPLPSWWDLLLEDRREEKIERNREMRVDGEGEESKDVADDPAWNKGVIQKSLMTDCTKKNTHLTTLVVRCHLHSGWGKETRVPAKHKCRRMKQFQWILVPWTHPQDDL